MFHLFLLIPNRIREIKEEGRKEGWAEGRAKGIAEARAEALAEAQAEGRKVGRAEAQSEMRYERLLKTAIKASREMGVDEERERVGNLLARYDRGEITFDELRATLANPLNGNNGAG